MTKKEIGTADARRCAQMDRTASNTIGHQGDFGARVAKIEQAEPQVCRLEVIDALRSVTLRPALLNS
jgi:hypothetical protein